MSAPRTLETHAVQAGLVFADTIRIEVSASIWTHKDRWGGTVTFSEFVAVEPGDKARFEAPDFGERPVEIVSTVRHEGGETTIMFRGLVPPHESRTGEAVA